MDAKWLRNSFVYLIILVAVMAILFSLFQSTGKDQTIPISEAMQIVGRDVQTTSRPIASSFKVTGSDDRSQRWPARRDQERSRRRAANSP